MKKVTVTDGQNLIDVVLQTCGSIEALLPFCIHNGLALDEELIAGTVVQVPTDLIADNEVVRSLESRSYRINTGNMVIEAQEATEASLHYKQEHYNTEHYK